MTYICSRTGKPPGMAGIGSTNRTVHGASARLAVRPAESRNASGVAFFGAQFFVELDGVIRSAVRDELALHALTARPVEKRLLSAAEAGHYIGRSTKAAYDLHSKGKLPGTKIDGKLQFDRKRLDELIDAHTEDFNAPRQRRIA